MVEGGQAASSSPGEIQVVALSCHSDMRGGRNFTEGRVGNKDTQDAVTPSLLTRVPKDRVTYHRFGFIYGVAER